MYLQLRGLCKASYIDLYWIPQNNHFKDASPLYYVGFTSSRIVRNAHTEEWELSTFGKEKNPSGVSDSNLHGVLLGRSQWLVQNDGRSWPSRDFQLKHCLGCNKGKPYNLTVKLTGCADDEFTCDDGQCIDINTRHSALDIFKHPNYYLLQV